jgi:hypothetical protein
MANAAYEKAIQSDGNIDPIYQEGFKAGYIPTFKDAHTTARLNTIREILDTGTADKADKTILELQAITGTEPPPPPDSAANTVSEDKIKETTPSQFPDTAENEGKIAENEGEAAINESMDRDPNTENPEEVARATADAADRPPSTGGGSRQISESNHASGLEFRNLVGQRVSAPIHGSPNIKKSQKGNAHKSSLRQSKVQVVARKTRRHGSRGKTSRTNSTFS